MTCTITGCTLFIRAEEKCLHGDLHKLDGTFIFNGCIDDNGLPAWQHRTQPNPAMNVITADGEYFERRGVVVFKDGHFNKTAEIYVAGGSRSGS